MSLVDFQQKNSMPCSIHAFGSVYFSVKTHDSLNFHNNGKNKLFTVFTVDEFKSTSYEPFFYDFGPLNCQSHPSHWVRVGPASCDPR